MGCSFKSLCLLHGYSCLHIVCLRVFVFASFIFEYTLVFYMMSVCVFLLAFCMHTWICILCLHITTCLCVISLHVCFIAFHIFRRLCRTLQSSGYLGNKTGELGWRLTFNYIFFLYLIESGKKKSQIVNTKASGVHTPYPLPIFVLNFCCRSRCTTQTSNAHR